MSVAARLRVYVRVRWPASVRKVGTPLALAILGSIPSAYSIRFGMPSPSGSAASPLTFWIVSSEELNLLAFQASKGLSLMVIVALLALPIAYEAFADSESTTVSFPSVRLSGIGDIR